MSRRDPDHIDYICMEWANERRKILGIILPEQIENGKIVGGFEPKERLGKLRCTLEAIREEGDGSSYGVASQNFPEVYSKANIITHRCWVSMQPIWKEVMHVHYVWREIPVKTCAAELGLEVVRYSEILDKLKGYVDGWLKSRQDAEEFA